MAPPLMRVILASQSEARLQVLRQAGLNPEVIVSGFDESSVHERDPKLLCALLAEGKGRLVSDRLDDDELIVIAADTLLEFEGRIHGKPGTEEAAVELWRRMRGHTGILHTGHFIMVRKDGLEQQQVRVQTGEVNFADLSDDELRAYAATGEPVNVAGGFSIHGLAGAFVTSIVGDPYNVVGLSLPLVRQMVIDMGVKWYELWDPVLYE